MYKRQGYSNEFSSVVTATSAMITPLIPPGIAMIIYGSIANVSIGKLFIAGFGPGILLTIALMVLVSIMSKRRHYMPLRDKRLPSREIFLSVKTAALPLMLPIVIIGGIRLGVFTPTEAGSVAIVYSCLLYTSFSRSIRILAEILISIIVIGVLCYFTKEGLRLAVQMARTNRVTNILNIPYSIIYGVFPMGCVLMLVNYCAVLALDVITLHRSVKNDVEKESEGHKCEYVYKQ